MTYIDGYIAAVPTANREAYRAQAQAIASLFIAYGALRIVEGWGDDVPDGDLTSFPLAVQRAPEETVVFSWIEWPSREVRDAAWPRILEDSRMLPDEDHRLFDGRRMIYGGFDMMLDQR